VRLTPQLRILALAGDIAATIADIRLRQPLSALCAAEGWTLTLRSFHDCTQAEIDAADVLVLQRGLSPRAWRWQQRMRASGGHVVFEIDDLLTAMPPQLLHQATVAAGHEWLLRGLADADVVSASTGRLAGALKPFARRVEVVPNFAAPNPPRAAPRDAAAPITLLFAASDRVLADSVVPAIAAVAAVRPQRLRLLCIGPAGLGLEGLGLPLQQQAVLPREAFLTRVAALVNPVAVIPLDDSPFSACKSAIKYFDYAAIGVPTLCSNLPPYADVATDGHDAALVDNTVGAWTLALLRAVDDPAWCQALADTARAEVAARHTLAATVDAWRQLLTSLGPRRAAPPAPRWAARLAERLMLALRAANRARLARRQRR
jgi:glycosyltransferase involved in cell wall biosynthesis